VGEAGRSCQRGPDDDTPCEEFLAAGGIGEATEGHADDGVNPDEGAGEEADLRVVKMKFLAHGLDEGSGDLAVVEIEDVDGEKDHHGEPQGVLLSFLRQGSSMLAHWMVPSRNGE